VTSDPLFAAHYATCSAVAVERMQQIEALVREIVPDVVPAIAYGIPTFKREGRNFVHWAGYDRHVGFYPGERTIAAFADAFGGRKHARGSVQFPHSEPMPLDLIESMVRFRLTV
jgi:uncharacterized protein YdhG (YjbR/CyaY superfamily)